MSRQEFAGKRVAIYGRFSSQMQREASLDDQVRRCSAYVTDRGGGVRPEFVFTDAALSGTSTQRPAFEKLMQLVDAVPPAVDVIVTEDISRISRDFVDAARIFQKLRYVSVPLIGVADGVDTSSQHAKLTFTIKSLVSDLYIDDLRDKTLRGLEGRALAGYSTGGLPHGYRSEPVLDAYNRVIGHRIAVDEEGAKAVRRLFELYVSGRSFEAIAHELNTEDVPPPRARTRHRRKGWVASTIREMLRNQAYIGLWTFNRRQWVKVPGLNKRRPKPKDPSAVIRREYPERRIVDEATWKTVQDRLANVRACYVRPSKDQPKEHAAGGRRNHFVLSGLLRCGACGAPMTIHAGTSARYYRCSDEKKRGTCTNKLSLREDVARKCLLGALKDRYATPAALAFLRKKLAEHLGNYARQANAELVERRARLERTEQRIAGLVHFIAEGDHSDYVRKTLQDLEAQARTEKAAIEALRQRAGRPIELPSPEEVTACVRVLEDVMDADPLLAREQLRALFEGGQLRLEPQPDRTYVAVGRIHLGALLTMRFSPLGAPTARPKTPKGQPPLPRESALPDWTHLWSSDGCAGRI